MAKSGTGGDRHRDVTARQHHTVPRHRISSMGVHHSMGAEGIGMTDQTSRTEEEWRTLLSPQEYQVLRQGATEAPFTGRYTDAVTVGVYRCRACGAELFRSQEKFASHCGWPSFFAPLAEDRVVYLPDNSVPGQPRTEVRCARCHSHLGHVFAGEGYDTPTDLRYCINSICLTLEPADGVADDTGSDSPLG